VSGKVRPPKHLLAC